VGIFIFTTHFKVQGRDRMIELQLTMSNYTNFSSTVGTAS